MAFRKGHHQSSGNKGGGRLKSGDVQHLLDLWNGKVKLPIVEIREIKSKNCSGTETIRKIEIFKSGKDAFAYRVLTGDEVMIRSLLNKLYADKSEVKTQGDPNYPLEAKVFLMSNPKFDKI